MTRKTMFFSLPGLILFVALAGCGQTPSPATPSPAPGPQPKVTVALSAWDSVVAAGKREGEVLAYFNAPTEARQAIPAAFNQKFGIRMDVVAGSAAELNTRLNSEYRAGIHQADLLMVGSTAIFSTVKPNGFLSPLQPSLLLPEVNDARKWMNGKLPFFDKDGQIIAYLSQVIPPIVVNNTIVKQGEITSYLDLLKPQWKGKIVIFDPSIGGAGVFGATTLGVNLGLDKAKEYLTSLLKQQEAVVTRDQRQQIEWVSHGKYPVAVWPQTPAVIEFLKAGAPLAAATIKENKGVSASNGGLAIPNKAAHRNAAVVFINWFLSPEGQTLAVKTMGAPTSRIDVPPEGVAPMFIVRPGDKILIQNEEFATQQNKWAREWPKVIAR